MIGTHIDSEDGRTSRFYDLSELVVTSDEKGITDDELRRQIETGEARLEGGGWEVYRIVGRLDGETVISTDPNITAEELGQRLANGARAWLVRDGILTVVGHYRPNDDGPNSTGPNTWQDDEDE